MFEKQTKLHVEYMRADIILIIHEVELFNIYELDNCKSKVLTGSLRPVDLISYENTNETNAQNTPKSV